MGRPRRLAGAKNQSDSSVAELHWIAATRLNNDKEISMKNDFACDQGWITNCTTTACSFFLHQMARLRYRRQRKQHSDLSLDGLPLIKGTETSHLLTVGEADSGKSNLFHTLLPQIRKRGDRAIIVDLTGDFVGRYYDCCSDLLLNPFDLRHQNWSPWAECQTDSHYASLAHAMIPEKWQTQDPFWENASRIVLEAALKTFAKIENLSPQDLYHLLVETPMTEYQQFFAGTEAAFLTDELPDKAATSIRSYLSTQLVGLKHLNTSREPFSIRNWVRDGDSKSWLFLSALPDQQQTLQGLMTTWMDTAIRALVTLEPEPEPDPNRRLWFVIDELSALNRLSSLEVMLAEMRKYGGCVLAGFQSMPQLIEIYGTSITQNLLSLFNTQVFFHSTDSKTTEWISKVLGEIPPQEIAALENLQCYVKRPGSYPVAKLQMRDKTLRQKTLGFLERPVALSKISPKKMTEQRELEKDEKTAESKDELERNLV